MPESFPLLHTNRLDLVEITQAHLADIYRLFGNDQVTRFYNLATMTTDTEAQKMIDWFSGRFLNNAGIRWGIALKDQQNIIGTIGYNQYTKRHKANLGYDLHPDFWNNGYLTEAIKVVIEFGFTQLEINRIDAEVMPGNIASEKVLAKAGFKREGILRQWMYWNNTHFDMTMFSLLQSDLKYKNML